VVEWCCENQGTNGFGIGPLHVGHSTTTCIFTSFIVVYVHINTFKRIYTFHLFAWILLLEFLTDSNISLFFLLLLKFVFGSPTNSLLPTQACQEQVCSSSFLYSPVHSTIPLYNTSLFFYHYLGY
jgi:hypothetical protein